MVHWYIHCIKEEKNYVKYDIYSKLVIQLNVKYLKKDTSSVVDILFTNKIFFSLFNHVLRIDYWVISLSLYVV